MLLSLVALVFGLAFFITLYLIPENGKTLIKQLGVVDIEDKF